ncbi:Gamma-2-syntrophin-like [Oopsacas minuta]|uniref:Gamma-2-syntrophin-like n=1 Tax=Oopsacas minuta TaxID=111878 RepID=A0AAV7JHV2_9METZ|nr:Gamma-2-syntrophin-like [Oopsacas minuta]
MDIPTVPSEFVSRKLLDPLTLLDIELPEILHALLPTEGIKERVKIMLGVDSIFLYRKNHEEAIHETKSYEFDIIDLQIQIEPHEGLGVTIIGEQPVRVSRIFPDSPADLFGVKGDDIIDSINNVNISQLDHDTVVKFLKSLSGTVTLTILRTKLLNSIQSIWEHYLSIPLLHASVSLYKSGTVVRLNNGFSICSADGEKCVIIYCDDKESTELLLWVTALKKSLLESNLAYTDGLNRLIPRDESVLVTGFLFEQLHPSPNLSYWERKFVVCTQREILIYSSPPPDGHSWEQFDTKLDLMTTTFHILKERNDLRTNSFILRSGFGTHHILSAETWDDLMIWVNALCSSTPKLVVMHPLKRYTGIWKKRRIVFEINFSLSSIQLLDYIDNMVIYSWPFSTIEYTKESLNSSLVIRFIESSIPEHQPSSIQVQLENIPSVIHTLRSFLLTKLSANEPKYVQTFTLNAF